MNDVSMREVPTHQCEFYLLNYKADIAIAHCITLAFSSASHFAAGDKVLLANFLFRILGLAIS